MKRRITTLMASLLVAAVFSALAAWAEDTITIPAGTMIRARLISTLSSKTNTEGDPFTAEVTEPVISGPKELVPNGSTVEGRITYLKQGGRVKGVAQMRLVAETITTPDGSKYDITAGLENAQGAAGAKVKGEEGTIEGAGKNKKQTGIETGIGAGVGAGVGAIADGGTGALYGAAIGAMAGVVHGLSKHHPPVTLAQGTELTFVISRATTGKKIAPAADTSRK